MFVSNKEMQELPREDAHTHTHTPLSLYKFINKMDLLFGRSQHRDLQTSLNDLCFLRKVAVLVG